MLTIASALLSFAYACAMPFTAMATYAALKLRPRDALTSIAAAWLINQVIGYRCLNYPQTPESFAWGIALGVATYAALILAMQIASRFQKTEGLIATLLAFVAAFAAFKALLFGTSFVIAGGRTAFSWPAFEKIMVINAATLPVLFALNSLLSFIIRPTARLAVADARTQAWYEHVQDRVVTL